jgi:hypothetical protein
MALGNLKIENYVPVVKLNKGIYSKLSMTIASGATVTLPSTTTIGGSSVSALGVITSTSANALTAGANGATNPVFNVDASTSSVATGLNIKGAAAAAGIAVSAISSGTDEALTVDAKGAGLLTLNGTGTGNVVIGHGLTGSTQALSGAGAVNLTTLTTKVTSTGANALTLANGADGQVKVIVMVVDGGDATLTPTTKTGFSTIVFNDIGDGCVLVYTTTTGWIVAGNFGATIS